MIRLLLTLAVGAIYATINPLSAEGQEAAEGVNHVDTSDMVGSLKRCKGPQVAMNQCARDHAQVAAFQFKAASDRVRLTLDPTTEQPAFDRAQTAYLDFVKASCELDTGRFAGGSIVGWMRDSCMARRLAARIRSLNGFAECKGCVADTTLTDFDLGELP